MKRRRIARISRNSGKQSFSAADLTVLPLEALTARYSLNLLSFAPLHAELLEMIGGHIGFVEFKKVVVGAFQAAFPEDMPSAIQDADDLGELAMLTPCFAMDSRFTQLESELRSVLTKALAPAVPSISGKCAYQQRVDKVCEMLTLDDQDMAIIELFAVNHEASIPPV